MKAHYIVIAIMVFIVATSFEPKVPFADEEVPYPEGYREWAHVKTGIVGSKSPAFQTTGGFHHIYANEKAMEGYATGAFPEGSVLVFDVIEAVEGEDSNIREGNRKHIDVMVKNGPKYVSTGGWGYEEFKGEAPQRVLTSVVKAQCFNCHAKQGDFVFSELRK